VETTKRRESRPYLSQLVTAAEQLAGATSEVLEVVERSGSTWVREQAWDRLQSTTRTRMNRVRQLASAERMNAAGREAKG